MIVDSINAEKFALKLTLIKCLHTLIWCMFVSLIMYVLWSGITSNVSVYSWASVALVVGEGLVLLMFKGSCPLTIVARKYSNSSMDNFDIYLPNWLAKYNKWIFGTLFIVGVILLIISSIV